MEQAAQLIELISKLGQVIKQSEQLEKHYLTHQKGLTYVKNRAYLDSKANWYQNQIGLVGITQKVFDVTFLWAPDKGDETLLNLYSIIFSGITQGDIINLMRLKFPGSEIKGITEIILGEPKKI